MATVNPRINVTVPTDIAILLHKTAKQNNKSVSKVVLDIIEWAIEEREDLYFSKIADAIEQSDPKWIKDSDEIWEA